jgi:hypothetical protein
MVSFCLFLWSNGWSISGIEQERSEDTPKGRNSINMKVKKANVNGEGGPLGARGQKMCESEWKKCKNRAQFSKRVFGGWERNVKMSSENHKIKVEEKSRQDRFRLLHLPEMYPLLVAYQWQRTIDAALS